MRKVVIEVADLNRLRWLDFGLRTNQILHAAVAGSPAGRRPILIDSLSLLRKGQYPGAHSFVILWDGYRSYTELVSVLPGLAGRDDIKWIGVGLFQEALCGFERIIIPLNIAESVGALKRPARYAQLSYPVSTQLQLVSSTLRTIVRPIRNAGIDIDAHAQLLRGGNIVFCGVVSPTSGWLSDVTNGTRLTSLVRWFAPLNYFDEYAKLSMSIRNAYEALIQFQCAEPSDHVAQYGLLNLLHRLLVLGALRQKKVPLLIKQYGIDRHFDPYDAVGYDQNIFLDFGSQRGPDAIYPRVIDLMLTHKKFLQLRLMSSKDSIAAYTRNTSWTKFVERCQAHADQATGWLRPTPISNIAAK